MRTFNPRSTGILLALLILAAAALLWSRSGVEGPTHVVVLGTMDDAGQPFPGCRQACCGPGSESRTRAGLALVEPESQRRWIFDATPDLPAQLALLDELAPVADRRADPGLGLDGIFITSPVFGHVAGLDYLGPFGAGVRRLGVHGPPSVAGMLPAHATGDSAHFEVSIVEDQVRIELGELLTVIPVRVPGTHAIPERYAYILEGPGERVLYAPSVGSWEDWPLDFVEVLRRVNRAFVDGTHFDRTGTDHPPMTQLIDLLADVPQPEREKIRFIHLAHDNPALTEGSEAAERVAGSGMGIARSGERVSLY